MKAIAMVSKILVVDYGSQYTMLIARRLRELGAYSEVVAAASKLDEALEGARGVILSGGPSSVTEDDSPELDAEVLAAKVPVLGICYGMQALAAACGGEVRPCAGERGYGRATATISESTGLLAGAAKGSELSVWMSHGDCVAEAPAGFSVLATGTSAPVMAMADEGRHLYGLQFHPEVTHTEQGENILRHFVSGICKLDVSWGMPSFAEHSVADIKAQVGDEQVLLALSGGVDSAVAAALIELAVPGQLDCVLVDTGLMRAGEVEQVRQSFAALGGRLQVVDASLEYFSQLAGITDPEEKRRIIGRLFIEVFEAKAKEMGNMSWLGQGTIYPDVIESAGAAGAAKIKSHHNVGGLPDTLGLKLLEPLRMLFKDEVRRLGAELGLSKELVWRHPFPGPGLGVRILGAVDSQRAKMVRQADAIFLDELRSANWYDKVAQAFAVLLPVDSVGVQGDGRTYENVVALRAVTTADFMTAEWAQLPYDLLERCSGRITNEVAGVNRIVYDVSSKPPATVEWE